MLIAVTTSGNDIAAPLESRFGRAPKFLVIDTDSDQITLIDNRQNMAAAQGAGIQAAQNVINANVEAIITGHTGPKAFNLLKLSGVKVYHSDAATVQEALDQFKKGELKNADNADVEGHW
jgi:predicted Fe-Mo cluster-binding NifX family protein